MLTMAWHFVAGPPPVLRDGTPVTVGMVTEYDGPLVLCHSGLHASERAIDALRYAPGPSACRVECGGKILRDTDKLVCSRRTVLAMADCTRLLHQFACWCVRETPLADGRKVWDLLTDPRSRAAVECKERWIEGKATDSDLAAAWDAATAAPWVAAGDAQNTELERRLAEVMPC